MSNTRPYGIWVGMIRRCKPGPYVQNRLYFGRGIRVCERWQRFEAFWADMGASYFEGASIDRIDSKGNYEPGNCRWLPLLENMRRSVAVVWIEWNGERRTLSDWARVLGLTKQALHLRIKRWPLERAMQPRNVSAA